jgi:hypothetical protein
MAQFAGPHEAAGVATNAFLAPVGYNRDGAESDCLLSRLRFAESDCLLSRLRFACA